MFLLLLRRVRGPVFLLAQLAYRNVNLQVLILAPTVLVLLLLPGAFDQPDPGPNRRASSPGLRPLPSGGLEAGGMTRRRDLGPHDLGETAPWSLPPSP